MIAESEVFLGVLLSASFGFLIGEAFGDSRRHRKCLEQENEELREQLQNNPSNKRICEAHSISSAASSMTSTSALSP